MLVAHGPAANSETFRLRSFLQADRGRRFCVVNQRGNETGVNTLYWRHRVALICVGLVLVTAGLYWPVTGHDFVNIDDPRFVTENAQVQAGLTWPGVVWAFQSVYTEAWQPLTWFSHILDCQIYGLNPGGHHLTSLLWHLANTVLLFLWLNGLTKSTWRSAFVAAFFAWHPLHVESVAWVCERKDVLSAFFWLATLLAYTRYVGKPGAAAYALVLVLFALGLMSKPMMVTLPCVLLLLDFWPFNRWHVNFGATPHGRPTLADFHNPSVIRKTVFLVAEKIPFFLLVLGMTAITLFAQKAGDSLSSLASLPLKVRVANALVSYLDYLTTTFWPTGLAYFYPYSFNLPLAPVVGGALILLVLTACALARVRRQPYLLVGWLWFVGTLVPTIGLVQFCIQARADRYTYIPSIGFFMMVVWGATELAERRPAMKQFLAGLGGLALAGCLAVSSVQLSYWKDSMSLSRHAIKVTENNYVALESLGRTLSSMGQPQRAITFFAQASAVAPTWPQGQFNYGFTLGLVGQTNEAIERLRAAVNLVPGVAAGRSFLGLELLKFGRTDEALREFAAAAQLDPRSADAQLQWGTALAKNNQPAEAMPHFLEALRLEPRSPTGALAHCRLAQALQHQGKLGDAVQHFREALRQTPNLAEAKTGLDAIISAHPELR